MSDAELNAALRRRCIHLEADRVLTTTGCSCDRSIQPVYRCAKFACACTVLSRSGALRLCGKNCTGYERNASALIPRELCANPAPIVRTSSGPWFWRTYADLACDVHDWCDQLPQVSAVCGVPRSGVLPATLIAMRRNIPLLSFDALLAGSESYRKAESRPINTPAGPVLVVDDTSWSGHSMRRYRDMLKGRKVVFGAVYAGANGLPLCDVHHTALPSIRHTFEWNVLRDVLSQWVMTDFDGVLCEDWRGGNEDLVTDAYTQFLANAKPKIVPKYEVRAIVTGRIGEHEAYTRNWLSRHGVTFKRLVHTHQTRAERDVGNVPARKAEEYGRDREAWLFVESDIRQAREIHRLTSRPVLCTDTMEMLQS